MRRVGVLTGIAAERRIIAAAARNVVPAPVIACAGANVARARREVRRLRDAGAQALLSFGLAGGLDPAVPTGTLIVGNAVVDPSGESTATDSAWRDRVIDAVAAAGLDPLIGSIAGSDRLIDDAAAKQALGRRTAAVAVDMESHVLADAARASGVPLLIVRTIADTASRTLPRAALDSIGPTGRTRLARIGVQVLARPGDVPSLLRLGREAATALATLRRLARAAGPALFNAG